MHLTQMHLASGTTYIFQKKGQIKIYLENMDYAQPGLLYSIRKTLFDFKYKK